MRRSIRKREDEEPTDVYRETNGSYSTAQTPDQLHNDRHINAAIEDGKFSSQVKDRSLTSTTKLTNKTRCRPHVGLAVLLIFMISAVPASIHLSSSHLKIITALGLVGLAYKLLTFKRWGDEHRYVPRFLVCFLLMLLELVVENLMVWLVSVTDVRKYQAVPPLQDNLEMLVHLMSRKWGARVLWVARGRWCNVLHFLGALLVLAFSVIWDQVPYSGFGLMSRVVLTIAFSRVLRIACFMTTVLPNPVPNCYNRRFPPVPRGAWAVIKAGYTHIRGFGGCNDLIFSGHAAFWVLAPLAFQTYYPRYKWVSALLWLAFTQASVRDVVDKQHYSVDMLVAVIATWGVWNALQWVYPQTQPLAQRSKDTPADKPNIWVLGLIAFALLAAGVIVIAGKA